MVLWVEINRWKIPVPVTGWMVKLGLQKAGKLDAESSRRIWKVLKKTSRQFPDWTLVEVEESHGERIKIRIRK